MGLSFLLKLEKYGSKDREMQRYYGSRNLIIVQQHFYHDNCSYVYLHYNYCLPFGLKLETYCMILHAWSGIVLILKISIKAATEITLVGLK